MDAKRGSQADSADAHPSHHLYFQSAQLDPKTILRRPDLGSRYFTVRETQTPKAQTPLRTFLMQLATSKQIAAYSKLVESRLDYHPCVPRLLSVQKLPEQVLKMVDAKTHGDATHALLLEPMEGTLQTFFSQLAPTVLLSVCAHLLRAVYQMAYLHQIALTPKLSSVGVRFRERGGRVLVRLLDCDSVVPAASTVVPAASTVAPSSADPVLARHRFAMTEVAGWLCLLAQHLHIDHNIFIDRYASPIIRDIEYVVKKVEFLDQIQQARTPNSMRLCLPPEMTDYSFLPPLPAPSASQSQSHSSYPSRIAFRLVYGSFDVRRRWFDTCVRFLEAYYAVVSTKPDHNSELAAAQALLAGSVHAGFGYLENYLFMRPQIVHRIDAYALFGASLSILDPLYLELWFLLVVVRRYIWLQSLLQADTWKRVTYSLEQEDAAILYIEALRLAHHLHEPATRYLHASPEAIRNELSAFLSVNTSTSPSRPLSDRLPFHYCVPRTDDSDEGSRSQLWFNSEQKYRMSDSVPIRFPASVQRAQKASRIVHWHRWILAHDDHDFFDPSDDSLFREVPIELVTHATKELDLVPLSKHSRVQAPSFKRHERPFLGTGEYGPLASWSPLAYCERKVYRGTRLSVMQQLYREVVGQEIALALACRPSAVWVHLAPEIVSFLSPFTIAIPRSTDTEKEDDEFLFDSWFPFCVPAR